MRGISTNDMKKFDGPSSNVEGVMPEMNNPERGSSCGWTWECVLITAVPITKLFAWGEGDSGGGGGGGFIRIQ